MGGRLEEPLSKFVVLKDIVEIEKITKNRVFEKFFKKFSKRIKFVIKPPALIPLVRSKRS